MWEYIIKRVITEGEYIAAHGATVRDAAKHFSVSKSTVHTGVCQWNGFSPSPRPAQNFYL